MNFQALNYSKRLYDKTPVYIFPNPYLTLVKTDQEREIDPLAYVANGNQQGRKSQRKVEFHMNPNEKGRLVSHTEDLCF